MSVNDKETISNYFCCCLFFFEMRLHRIAMQTNSKDYITIAVLILETKISTREKKTAKTLFHYTNEINLLLLLLFIFTT